MTIEGFDYKDFADSMAEQADSLVPSDMDKEAKEYLKTTLHNFTFLAGESLYKDNSIEITSEQACFITQIIAEWTFHKSVDLARSGVPKKYWNSVMQKIAFTAFEVAKQSVLKGVSEEVILPTVEEHIKKCWAECLDELAEKNVIDETAAENDKLLSNIDKMAKEAAENGNCDDYIRNTDNENSYENNTEEDKTNCSCNCTEDSQCKVSPFFLDIFIPVMFTLPVIVGIFCVIYGLYLFCKPFTDFCHKYILTIPFIQHHPIYVLMCIFSIIGIIGIIILKKEVNKDVQRQLQELEDIRKNMQDLVNPNKMYERLGVDVLSLQVGSGLLEIADPDQEGQLLAKTAALRQELTDEYGYIIPNIRILDSVKLDKCEYTICVRDNIAESGYVYPGRYMVIADEWDKYDDNIPENAIVGVDPTYKCQAYWLLKEDLADKKKITAVEATDVIITHMKEVFIKFVGEIMVKTDVIKLMELVRSQDPTLVNDLVPELISATDIKKILVNLIREKISIKDIIFIFERLNDYARFTQDADILSERIRAALDRQISLQNCSEDNVIYAVNLSKDWENVLEESKIKTETTTMFMLEPEKIQELVETTALTLMKAHQMINLQPVILCSPGIRLPLYQLLSRHIPTVVVMSYSELFHGVKVESVMTIGEDDYE